MGVGTTDPKSILDIQASNSAAPVPTDGILIPRLADLPATNPNSDQHGMLIFLTNTVGTRTPGFYYWDNTIPNWVAITSTGEWQDGTNTDGDNLIFARQAEANGFDFVFFDDGRLGIGTDDPVEAIEIKRDGDNDIQLTSASSNPPNLIFQNNGGSIDSPTFVSNDQELGAIVFNTFDGTREDREVAGIRIHVDLSLIHI